MCGCGGELTDCPCGADLCDDCGCWGTCRDERPDPACLDCGSDDCDGYPMCHIPEDAL